MEYFCDNCRYFSGDKLICERCGAKTRLINNEESAELLDEFVDNLINSDRMFPELEYSTSNYTPKQQYTPKCPVCQSPNISKLSTVNRAAHGFAFGLFSKTARSQWVCSNCGNKF